MYQSGVNAYLYDKWYTFDWEGVICNEVTDVVGAIDMRELNDNKEWW